MAAPLTITNAARAPITPKQLPPGLRGYGISPTGQLTPPTDIHGGGLAAAAAPTPGVGVLSAAQIQQQANKFKAQLPPALTDQQIQTRAQGELDPLVQRISQALQTQLGNAGQAIQGYTGSLAAQLASQDYGAPYRGAQQQQAAVDSALSSALAGQGTADAQGLQARLAQLNEPGVVGQAAQAVQGNAVGNSNTVLGAGSSNLGALIANQAAAENYGQQLPGIAKLAGLQSLASVQQTGAKSLADQTGTLMQQLPGIVNDLRSQSQTNQTNRATLGERVGEYLAGANAATVKGQQVATAKAQQLFLEGQKLGLIAQNQTFTQWYKGQQLAQGQTRLNQNGQRITAQIRQGDQRLAQGQTKLGIAQQNADTATLRAAVYRYKAENPTTGKLTAEQTQRYVGLANTIAGYARNGNPNHLNASKQSDPLLPISYGAALSEMMQGDGKIGAVPYKIAVAALNKVYPPGVQGRPLGKGIYGPVSPLGPNGKPVAR